ncbi:MAG: hypothetical protein ACYC7E_19730 [Armatimonadota bacterium]
MIERNPEEQLPPDILRRAVRSGHEYGWRKDDVIRAIEAARDAGLATLGGQAQFVFPERIFDLYWLHYDPADWRQDETWHDYVARSARESIEIIGDILAEVDIAGEGVQSYPQLQKKLDAGVALEDHLVFIVSFVDEAYWRELERLSEEVRLDD